MAIINGTYDEQVAVGATRRGAVGEVSRMAHAYLRQRGAILPETSTPRKVAEYFGVRVYEAEVTA